MFRLLGFYDYTVILTYLSLLAAVSGIFLASQGSFTAAVLCLMVSGICDAFDGTVARTKKNRTDDEKSFGIQLDSLCDVVSFGVFPACLCYFWGMKSLPGIIILLLFSLCAVIRLAYFNVLEINRQKTESGGNKVYRGLPVTSISMILPPFYLLRLVLPEGVFLLALHGLMALVALLFVLDFPIRKMDISRLFRK